MNLSPGYDSKWHNVSKHAKSDCVHLFPLEKTWSSKPVNHVRRCSIVEFDQQKDRQGHHQKRNHPDGDDYNVGGFQRAAFVKFNPLHDVDVSVHVQANTFAERKVSFCSFL